MSNDCHGELYLTRATVMLLSSMEDHWTFVPTSLLRELEINIQTVKENLLRKQDLLTKVYSAQFTGIMDGDTI